MIYNGDVPGRILPRFTMDIKRRHKCDVNVAVFGGDPDLSLKIYEASYKGNSVFLDPMIFTLVLFGLVCWMIRWKIRSMVCHKKMKPAFKGNWVERKKSISETKLSPERGWICMVCSKEGKISLVMEHIEAKPHQWIFSFLWSVYVASQPIPGTRWGVIESSK